MYNHAIAAMALSEAWGMSGIEQLRQPAQKAIDFLVAAQNPGKGWRYTARCGENDSSVTGWCVMALKSAELADLAVPRSCIAGANAWFKEATDERAGWATGYDRKGTGQVHNADNRRFDNHPALSAVAVMCRIFMNRNKREPALAAAALLIQDRPKWGAGTSTDVYYWYHGSMALFQLDGADGPTWKAWNEPMKNALVPTQKTGKDGCENGSWDPRGDRWGSEGGRVTTTALGALTLEIYYRYRNVFGSKH